MPHPVSALTGTERRATLGSVSGGQRRAAASAVDRVEVGCHRVFVVVDPMTWITTDGRAASASAYRPRAAPQAPPDPDHFPDQDVGEGRGFDLDGAGGIGRLVRVVGAEDEGVAGAGDLLLSLRPPQTQR